MAQINVFAGKKTYNESEWDLVESRNFNQDEQGCITSAEVTMGAYGLSCCFHLNGGGKVFYDLDKGSKLEEGDVIDMSTSLYRTYKSNKTGKIIERVLAYIKD